MAIEIHIPETEEIKSAADLNHALSHLLPTIFAYLVSFSFIGAIWYQHLKIFGYLKGYDARLVFLNLLLLFFVGLFPFSATLISKNSDVSMFPFYFYIGIIFACLGAITLIENYVFVKSRSFATEFLNTTDISAMLKKHEERKLAMIILSMIIVCIIAFNYIFAGTIYTQFSSIIFAIFPVVYMILKKRRERRG
ncbi:MAG: DUF1211 domain-containing protein [Bacteroidetes bacterium]|nr:DUF1211 domain-containing protein [Bacteroidota bacterium]